MLHGQKLLNVLGGILVGFFITTTALIKYFNVTEVEGVLGALARIYVEEYLPAMGVVFGIFVPILFLVHYIGRETAPMPADSNRPLFILLGAEITAMAVVISVVSFVKFSSPYF